MASSSSAVISVPSAEVLSLLLEHLQVLVELLQLECLILQVQQLRSRSSCSCSFLKTVKVLIEDKADFIDLCICRIQLHHIEVLHSDHQQNQYCLQLNQLDHQLHLLDLLLLQ